MKARLIKLIAAASIGAGCLGVGTSPAAARADDVHAIGLHSLLTARFTGDECEAGSKEIWKPKKDFEGILATDLVQFNSVHDFYQGDGVRVAIIDSGVAAKNPAFAGAKIEKGIDLTGEDNAHADPYGHGTAVASIIAGQNDSDAPINGLAPKATIVPVKVVSTPPREITPAYTTKVGEQLIEGIRWATEQKVDVINISASLEESDPKLEDAISDAVRAGIVVIASAGNLSGDVPEDYDPMEDRPRYPASYDGVLSVTAVDSFGLGSARVVHSETQDISAPGTFYVVANGSTGTCLTALDNPSTSYAAAYASGVMALLMSAHPDESSQELIHRLTTTAVRANPDEKDYLTAWGIIDPVSAVNFIDDGSVPGPNSPNFDRRKITPRPGRDVPVPPPDPLGQSQEAGSIWASAGVLGAVTLLVAAAGIGRMARKEDTN